MFDRKYANIYVMSIANLIWNKMLFSWFERTAKCSGGVEGGVDDVGTEWKLYNQEFARKKRISHQCTVKHGNIRETRICVVKIWECRRRKKSSPDMLMCNVHHLMWRCCCALAICILCCSKSMLSCSRMLDACYQFEHLRWVEHEPQFNTPKREFVH